MKYPILASAVATAVSLPGGMVAGVAIANLIDRLPSHALARNADLLGGIAVAVGMFGGGAFWGYLLTRIHHIPKRKKVLIAGSASFGLSVIAVAPLLLMLERALVQGHRLPGMAVHVTFTLLFVPATLLVAATGSSVILLVTGRRRNWFRSALSIGLAASFSFLIVDVGLDVLGMRVGGLGAAQHATMLTVAFLGVAAAAFSAGGMLGHVLSGGAADASTAGE